VLTAVPRALQLTVWSVLAISVAGWLAVVEVLWLPLRVGGVLVPVSVVAAVVGNLVLAELVLQWSRSRTAALLPAFTWVGVALAASTRRAEGDLLVIGSGGLGAVGLAFLGLGVVAAAVGVGRAMAYRPPWSGGRISGSGRAGSGSGGAR
jgi:hypothetical protein